MPTIITAIAYAAYYRSTSKLTGPAIAVIVVGAIVGALAVQLSIA